MDFVVELRNSDKKVFCHGGTEELIDSLKAKNLFNDIKRIIPKNLSEIDQKVQDSIQTLFDCGVKSIVLDYDKCMKGYMVYLVASIYYDKVIEYQVCDGLPGNRSTAYDHYVYSEALNHYNKCQMSGM